MNTIAKTIFGTVLLAGSALVFAAPASAGVSIGIGFGPGYYPPAPGYYGGPVCDPYSRYYNPYECDDEYYEYYVGPPLYIDGYWYDRPMRSRYYGGHREFWVGNGWRHGEFYRGGGNFYRGNGGPRGSGGHGGSYGGRGGGPGGNHGGGHGGGPGGGRH